MGSLIKLQDCFLAESAVITAVKGTENEEGIAWNMCCMLSASEQRTSDVYNGFLLSNQRGSYLHVALGPIL